VDHGNHDFSPEQYRFEMQLMQKFIIENKGKMDLFFEEGRLQQMISKNVNDP
jgi:hypothetical protein